jgi:uncharacterized membrane protein YkoI
MSTVRRVVPCTAVVAAVLLAGGSHVTGQSAPATENGRSNAVRGAASTLPAAMGRVDTMLRIGELDIASVQDDTMMSGRAHERLKQVFKGVPVFGGQVARQMDGRAVVSVSGRLYEGVDLDVTPQISPERAAEIAVNAAGSGANVHGDTTLGILPVEAGYRLVYKMEVRSDWDIREVHVDAKTGQIVRSFSKIQTSRAIGQGTGVLGGLRKMSTDATSSTFRAVDLLRPMPAYTLAFPGTPRRLNDFRLDGRPDRRRPRLPGVRERLLLQTIRPPRPRRQ